MEAPDKLDKLDRRVLYELDRNSRRSVSQLARALREGRDRVEYRIDRLVDRGIVTGFTPAINLRKLGFSIYKTYIRLENNRARVAEFVAYLERHPRVYWLAQCDGTWDLMIAVFALNEWEFHDIHTRMLSEFNEVVLNFSAYTLGGLNFYGRNYLTKSGNKFSYRWHDSTRQLVDRLDLKILELLTKNARMSSVEIAERLSEGAHNVRYRIERMERLEIITRYHVNVDLRKLGILFFKTQFFLRNYDLALRQTMIEYCNKSPHVTCYIEQIGDCNVEVEMEVEDHQQHYQIIDDIRGNSSKLIRNFQSILIRNARYSYLPHDIVAGLGLEEQIDHEALELEAA